MAIDFHDPQNRTTYASREADSSWVQAITALIEPVGLRVADIGCGGGIYSSAFLDQGASSVMGVDFSQAMISGAQERNAGREGIEFRQGDATATGLPSESVDLVFQRALIHHLADYEACFTEARRLLVPGGALLVQDRTAADVQQPASASHLRGYFFECFPRLLEVELKRRPDTSKVQAAMQAAGFVDMQSSTVWEDRRYYNSFEEYAQELAQRTGRSILHELSDTELEELIDYIRARVPANQSFVERDCWTLWLGKRGR